METLLQTLISDFHERPLPGLIPRQLSLPFLKSRATIVIGMRRTGKTWFCYQSMDELMLQGIEKQRILYINFEDERLLPMNREDLRHIPDTFYRMYPENRDAECYFYFDEIQNVQGWELFVRRLLDQEDVHIVLTGFSAKLLSAEIATSLRGRAYIVEIFPFSFCEYLSGCNVDLPAPSRVTSKARSQLEHALDGYLYDGGFPETLDMPAEQRCQILQGYVDAVVLRDVAERHGVRLTPALRHLIRHLLDATGTRFSINKFYNSLRSQGISCTKNLLYEYLQYMKDAYLVFPVRIHSRSEKARQVNPVKIYAIDNGLVGAMRYRPTRDRGAMLENAVYLQLRRWGFEIDYYMTSSGYEVDFLASKPGEGQCLIQVCDDPSDGNVREREQRALEKAMTETGIESGTVVTRLWEGQAAVKGGTINYTPFWRWALTREGRP